ncbi:hypothetical protein I8J29_02045 [Paenibacillus sp. MWE-103]|uniref:EamA-like transporter family protein n=1 Tax=Paenibacillus artemisiicola TaxID=1172618 RepID=A0ABS3W478_9BACL|nr:hypothetical protein [Paenibacillus artemisiicola]MBO7742960.1 hypothetical protein [Paenibacillus artemisiicola]
MIAIVIVLLVVSAISWYELRSLRGQGKGKEITVFLALMAAGSTLFSMQLTQVDLPNPLRMAMILFEPLSNAIFAMLS